jgi:tetratricopeptide (TPR) repeat protein
MERAHHDGPEELQQQALALHAEGRIDEAIEHAKAALALDPEYVGALQYLGSTYVARKRLFATGIRYLERALALAPTDPDLLYTAGWCYEFAAHELERGRGRWDGPDPRDPAELYEQAIAALRQSISLQNDPGLREDALKLLETITGQEEGDR